MRLSVAADSGAPSSFSAADISRSDRPATLRWVRIIQPMRAATSMRDAVIGVLSSTVSETRGTGTSSVSGASRVAD